MYVEENTKHFVTLHSTGAEESNLHLTDSIPCAMCIEKRFSGPELKTAIQHTSISDAFNALCFMSLHCGYSRARVPYLLQQIGCELCKLSGACLLFFETKTIIPSYYYYLYYSCPCQRYAGSTKRECKMVVGVRPTSVWNIQSCDQRTHWKPTKHWKGHLLPNTRCYTWYYFNPMLPFLPPNAQYFESFYSVFTIFNLDTQWHFCTNFMLQELFCSSLTLTQ